MVGAGFHIMQKLFIYLFGFLIVLALAIQLIPVERTNPSVTSELVAPIAVKKILERSCYDCHSNETDWPWYSYVAPVSWLVSHDVEAGREELNFSEWDRHSGDDDMLKEIFEETEEGEMPMPIYLITHKSASISEDELKILGQWAGIKSHTHHASHHEADD